MLSGALSGVYTVVGRRLLGADKVLKIVSTSDTAAAIRFMILARLALMPESCGLTCWRYSGWMKPTSARQPSSTPAAAGEDDSA
jgi:hypothetical protein